MGAELIVGADQGPRVRVTVDDNVLYQLWLQLYKLVHYNQRMDIKDEGVIGISIY